MAAFIEIVKAVNGNIEFNGLTGTSGGYKGMTFNSNHTINQKDSDLFQVMDGKEVVYTFRFVDVVSTQIAPAAAVPIGVTTANAFFTLMRTSFFFESVAAPFMGDLPLRQTFQTTTGGFVTAFEIELTTSTMTTFRVYAHALGQPATVTADKAAMHIRETSIFVASDGTYVELLNPTFTGKNAPIPNNFASIPAFTITLTGNKVLFRVHSGAAQIVNWSFYYLQTV